MLKEQLINEAKTIDASVELDSVFESVELSPEVKANFSTVFEATVKKTAIALAESHILSIAEKAEETVEAEKEKAKEDAEKDLTEKASKFFDHIASEWMAENKLAVDKGIKSDLFESVMVGFKELFVEHNVIIPEESVDVVAELEEELTENKQEAARLFEELNKREAFINEFRKEVSIKEATQNLTESQKEKVISLTEGMEYSDSFINKMNAIVEMVSVSKENKAITESVDINNIDTNADGLNFVTEAVENKDKKSVSQMDQYVASAARLS